MKNLRKSIMITTVLLITLTFLMTGCKEETASAKEITLTDVLGTWTRNLPDGTETITFKSDMTYHKDIVLTSPPPITATTDDTFTLVGNKLSINYSDFNTVSDYKITIEGDSFIWDSGEGTMEYHRKLQ